MIYIYDGSFDGFLCCVFDSYANKEVLTAICRDEDFIPTLFPSRVIDTDKIHANRVFKKVVKVSSYAGNLLQKGFLTCMPDKELHLYRLVVKLLRDAGAKEVHVRISSPPFLHPCYYGTDIDSEKHLIACHCSIPEIGSMIGADSLGYLPVEALSKLTGNSGFCCACFNGDYPTKIPTDTRKDRFEQRLSDRKR